MGPPFPGSLEDLGGGSERATALLSWLGAMEQYAEMARVYWAKWDELVANTVFGAIEGAFGTDIRSHPCPHTYDLFAVKTPTVLVTWAIIYLFVVGIGLMTITPANKTKKVRALDPIAFVSIRQTDSHSTSVLRIRNVKSFLGKS